MNATEREWNAEGLHDGFEGRPRRRIDDRRHAAAYESGYANGEQRRRVKDRRHTETRIDCAKAIEEIRSILWRDPETGELDPDKGWSVDALDDIAAVLDRLGLSPLTTGR